MVFRRSLALVVALTSAMAGLTASASYVVEAGGAGINGGAIATAADFDFVTHDFGIESGEAIQIALTHLSSAPNLRGNLLLWPVEAVGEEPAASPAPEELASAVSTATTGFVATGSSEDFSYYDEDTAAAGENLQGLNVKDAPSNASLPAGSQNLPAIDTKTIFWILKPAEFASFSQMMAARFGF